MKEIILASNSPRRKELLEKYNIRFTIKTVKCDEINNRLYEEKNIIKNSQMKASAVLGEGLNNTLIIAADTVVILDSVCLVKPQNIIEALFMLKKLSDKTHKVVTSHTIIDSDTKKEMTELSTSFVTFRKLSLFEIIKYVLIKKPLDKAGSYGIQDFINENNYTKPPKESFISKLEGSYYNVMGFDVMLIKKMLLNF